ENIPPGHSICVPLCDAKLNVTVPPVIRNFSIPWAVDGIALILLTPGLPIILLYREYDLTTMKFIHANVE
ncbi:hypothetical protein Tco_1307570, partial [Tanacetum coccineum]